MVVDRQPKVLTGTYFKNGNWKDLKIVLEKLINQPQKMINIGYR